MNLRQAALEKNDSLLNFLENLGRRAKNAWIFVDKNLANSLKKSAHNKGVKEKVFILSWDETEKGPAGSIHLRPRTVKHKPKWYEVVKVESKYVMFKKPAIDPEEIFFIKRWE